MPADPINFRKLRDSNHFPPNIAKLRTPEDPEDAKDFFYEGSAMLAGWTMLVSSLATIAQIFTGVCVQPPSAVGEVLVTGARRNDVFGGERRAWRGRTEAHGGSLRPPCVVARFYLNISKIPAPQLLCRKTVPRSPFFFRHGHWGGGGNAQIKTTYPIVIWSDGVSRRIGGNIGNHRRWIIVEAVGVHRLDATGW